MTLERAGAEIRSMSSVLRVQLSTRSPEPGVVEISIAGELDLATSGLLRDAVDACFARDRPTVLVIELADLTFIDAAGLRALWHARQLALSRGCEAVLQSPSEAVSHLLHLTKLDKVFAIEPPLAQLPPLSMASKRGLVTRNARGDP